jgi:hypothetical protein
MSKTVCGSCGAVEVATIEEKGISMPGFGQTGEKPGDGMQPVEGTAPARRFLPDGAGFVRKRKKAKKRRLHTLGAVPAKIMEGKSIEEFIDSDEEEVDLFLCGMDRKVYSEGDGPCASCPGGCHAEKGLPNLLEIEGLAEEDFGLKILGSAYGAQEDVFVVQMERKDGDVVEAYYQGSTADLRGFITLDADLVSGKSLEEDFQVITTDEAIQVALKSFEGGDAEGEDVDVYVGLDGTTLGYDIYEKALDPETDEEAEEEAPEEKSLESGVIDDPEVAARILAELEELANIASSV